MALTETTRTVKGKVLTFIETEAGVGILKAGLSAPDMKALNDIDTNGTGATLAAKMSGYQLSNGKDAAAVYGKLAFNMDEYAALVLKKYLGGARQSATIAEHESEITDHEARIATLEAAP